MEKIATINQNQANLSKTTKSQMFQKKEESGALKKSPTHSFKGFKGLKVLPLGGMEEIGRNMTVFEFGGDILIVDMGLRFPEEDMPGIDYIIPNISYLIPRSKNIRGVIITHGHYDHIGAIPHLMPELGNPPIYAGKLTAGIIKKRQEDYPKGGKLNIITVKARDKIKLGDNFEVEFLHLNHNIPDSFGLAIKTPIGTVVHSGDFKLDPNPIGQDPADIARLEQLGKEGVLLTISDSTSVEEHGHSISESEIRANLEDIFKENTTGRIIIATFASLISRIQQIFDLAEKYGRKIVIEGYSMVNNVEIAKNLGYLKYSADTQISLKESFKLPKEKVLILCTGAQGEGNAVLMRIATKEHPFIEIEPGDAIVFSSSIIPGNERTVQRVKDLLYRQGARVYHYKMMDIHAGGHGRQDDLKKFIQLTRPRFFIPMHGHYYMLKMHAELAHNLGIPWSNILILDNGDMALITESTISVKKDAADASFVMVDGLGVGDVGEIVLRDRQKMAQDGMFVIIVTLDSKTGKIRDKIDIISRGFVYLNEAKDLLKDVRKKIKDIVEDSASQDHTTDWVYVKDNLRNRIGSFLYQRTHRRPLVLPVVMEV